MKCEGCDNEATVHNLVIVNGKPKEQHLCEKCADKKGLGDDPVPVAKLLLAGMKQIAGEPSPLIGPERTEEIPAISCSSCGLTLAHFRHGGLLGCPACYQAFEAQLGPLLDRAHDGATHHTGKIPGRTLRGGQPGPGGTEVVVRPGIDLVDFQRREHALRKQLDAAISAEQFERAACIRDELRKLVDLVAGTGAAGGSAATAGPAGGSAD